ncbi:UNVERIFIED_CONTAM: IS256 family transposase, partial [Limosilactobacillus fermentum]
TLLPLTQNYSLLYANANLFKVHRGHVVTSNSLPVAIGIDPSGRREVLGFDIGDSESKAVWMDFFSELKQRSLTNVDMFVSDAHCGLKDAITTQIQVSLWHKCQLHSSNNCTSKLALKDRKEVAYRLKDLFNAPTHDQAVERRD